MAVGMAGIVAVDGICVGIVEGVVGVGGVCVAWELVEEACVVPWPAMSQADNKRIEQSIRKNDRGKKIFLDIGLLL
jgi:hypothetical protein